MGIYTRVVMISMQYPQEVIHSHILIIGKWPVAPYRSHSVNAIRCGTPPVWLLGYAVHSRCSIEVELRRDLSNNFVLFCGLN